MIQIFPWVSLKKSSNAKLLKLLESSSTNVFRSQPLGPFLGSPSRCWGDFRIWMFGGNIHKNLWWFIGPFLRFPWEFLLALIPCGISSWPRILIYIFGALIGSTLNTWHFKSGRQCFKTHPPGMWKSSVFRVHEIKRNLNPKMYVKLLLSSCWAHPKSIEFAS